ncbi:hypothetical protein B0H67DRAFT_559909 [Lasiosphaeris hirsuta]|uniref:Secreted protein n=1 Tax=Lasiosphaeris hirsuta TaxID=260670 RepID=A0AA40EA91_9PEZI|nr:hypothetical protein B0H67DRAFT_559909 [Lasiosphaeris hirsuta]
MKWVCYLRLLFAWHLVAGVEPLRKGAEKTVFCEGGLGKRSIIRLHWLSVFRPVQVNPDDWSCGLPVCLDLSAAGDYASGRGVVSQGDITRKV